MSNEDNKTLLERLKDPVERARLSGLALTAVVTGTAKAARLASELIIKAKDGLDYTATKMAKPKDALYKAKRETILKDNQVMAGLIQRALRALENPVSSIEGRKTFRAEIGALTRAIHSNMIMLSVTGTVFGFPEMSYSQALRQCGLDQETLEAIIAQENEPAEEPEAKTGE